MLWADVFVCRHEYTLGNLMFAVTVDAANQQLQQRLKTVQQLRAEGKPTIPSSMALELDTNPFLRVRPSTACITNFMPAQPEHRRMHAMSCSRPAYRTSCLHTTRGRDLCSDAVQVQTEAVAASVGLQGAGPVEVMAEVRARKDSWKPT